MSTLMDRMEATWPPAARFDHGPFVLREGLGGGSRVSSITLEGDGGLDDALASLPGVEAAARALGQAPLFLFTEGDARDAALADVLRGRGYRQTDEVFVFEGPLLPPAPPEAASLHIAAAWPADAAALAVWGSDGRVGAARMAVMERAVGPKAVISLCDGGQPVGALFVAIQQGIAVLHAIEVVPAARGRGYGHVLMRAASAWAQAQGATGLMLVVTKQNTPAVTLYHRHGLQVVGGYFYLTAA